MEPGNSLALMKLHSIQVECYAGARADERPRRAIIGGREHNVARLLNESVEESLAKKGRTRRYRVLTDEGLILNILRADDGTWYLESSRCADDQPSSNGSRDQR